MVGARFLEQGFPGRQWNGLDSIYSLQETYEAKRNEFLGELQKKEEEMRQMFVQRVKEKEAELKEAEKEVSVNLESRQGGGETECGAGDLGLHRAAGGERDSQPLGRTGVQLGWRESS